VKVTVLIASFLFVSLFGKAQAIKLAEISSPSQYFQLGEKVLIVSSANKQAVVSDGSLTGTRKIELPPFPQNFVQIAQTVFFFSYDEKSDYHSLNKIDVNGQIENLGIVNKYNEKNFPRLASAYQGGLIFFGADADNTVRLWKSNGTVASTKPFDLFVPNLSPNAYSDINTPLKLASVGSKALFSVTRSSFMYELWVTDGTTVGTQKILDSSYPPLTDGWAELNGVVYFSAGDLNGTELWRTDGTTVGTFMLTDLSPGVSPNENRPFSSFPTNFLSVGDKIFFTTTNGSLWQTDGVKSTELRKCKSSYCFANLTKFNDKLISSNFEAETGREPWISDGTSSTTSIVKDVWPGPASSISDYYYSFNTGLDKVLLPASNGSRSGDFWAVDKNGVILKMARFATMQAGNISWMAELGTNLLYLLNSSNNNFELFAERSNFSVDNNKQINRLPADYWFQTIGPISSFGGSYYSAFNYDMAVDKSNNVLIAGVQNGNQLAFYDNAYVSPMRYGPVAFLSKLGDNGLLLWSKDIQSTEMFYRNHASVAVDDADNIFYSTSFYPNPWGSVFFDAIPTDQNIKNYIIKFDKLGKQVRFSSGYGNGEILTSSLKVDKAGDLVMAGLYFGNSMQWQNLTTSSKESPCYFLQKFALDGQLKWVRSISTGWKEYGEITDVDIDEKNKRILMLISRGWRNVSSSCEYQRWPAQLIAFDFNGNEQWKKEFDCSDLMMANGMAVGPNGDILLVGYFRGKIDMENYSIKTDRNDGCSIFSSFLFRVSKDGIVLSGSTENPKNIEPFNIQFSNDGNYLVSGIERNSTSNRIPGFESYPSDRTQVFVREYDYSGQLLAERKFNKYGSDFSSSNPITRIDSNGDLLFSDRVSGKFDTIPYSVASYNASNIVIMKMRLATFQNKVLEENLKEGIQLFPNPANLRAYIKIWREQFRNPFFTAELIDMTGKIVVSTTPLGDDDSIAIDTSELSSGLYLLRVSNGEITTSKRLIIAH
jgi:ELWxxDGT repeat protein